MMTTAPMITTEWCARSAWVVAPDLIGCTIVRQFPAGRQLRGLIVETEAYQQDDPGCHGYRGRTPRTAVIFGPAGYSYVYLIYGIYHCLNLVTDRNGFGSAVLIRAVQLDQASLQNIPPPPRKSPEKIHRLAAGPGKLCQVMGIDRRHNAQPLAVQPEQAEPALWITHRTDAWQRSYEAGQQQLIQTTRIGLSQGQELPWRWYLQHCPAVSKRAVAKR
jgi:DNA-3-methyladenine glycosylase